MSPITREAVLQMDLKAIYAAVKDPATSKDMQTLLRDRAVASRVSELMLEAQNRETAVDTELARTVPPSTEQLAAEAAAMAAETPVVAAAETPAVAVVPPVIATDAVTQAHEAEDAEWKKVGVTIYRDANGVANRYVEEYQVCDEDGTAIGRPTRLDARTLPELASKKREAHENATRAFHRLKRQKLSFKQEKTVLTPEQISEAARVALESKDPAKVTDVIHQVIETEYQQRERDLKQKENLAEGRAIANEFMRRHLPDYFPCEANNKALGEYLDAHKLDYTLDNLEAAFEDLVEQGDKLAKAEKTVAAIPAPAAANPVAAAAVATPVTPIIPVTETPAAVPVSETPVPAQPAAVVAPVVEATAPTPAAAHNVQSAARRPGVNGAIAPGSLSAQRPGTVDPALTRKEFLQTVKKMDPGTMKKKLKTDPQFVKQLLSYGIKIQ